MVIVLFPLSYNLSSICFNSCHAHVNAQHSSSSQSLSLVCMQGNHLQSSISYPELDTSLPPPLLPAPVHACASAPSSVPSWCPRDSSMAATSVDDCSQDVSTHLHTIQEVISDENTERTLSNRPTLDSFSSDSSHVMLRAVLRLESYPMSSSSSSLDEVCTLCHPTGLGSQAAVCTSMPLSMVPQLVLPFIHSSGQPLLLNWMWTYLFLTCVMFWA